AREQLQSSASSGNLGGRRCRRPHTLAEEPRLMFGWFQPTCPVPPVEKVWIEQRMAWLADEFGLQRFKDAVVTLPTPEFFPDPYEGSENDARQVFSRVCGYMGVDVGRIELGFFT